MCAVIRLLTGEGEFGVVYKAKWYGTVVSNLVTGTCACVIDTAVGIL
jgi:hypothetical protein